METIPQPSETEAEEVEEEEVSEEESPSEEPTKTLNQQLQEYHAAIESEYNLVREAVATNNTKRVGEAARELLIKAVPQAARAIADLAALADSESVRLNACKYILDNALGEKGMVKIIDPIQDAIDALTATPEPDDREEFATTLTEPLPLFTETEGKE